MYSSGHKFSVGSIFGVSVALGSVILCPRAAYSMGGVTILEDDHRRVLLGDSKFEEDPHALLMLASKLLVPACLFLTVFMNAGHPTILAAKLIIILFTTKPSPFSVYMFVDQVRKNFDSCIVS
ncbi:hypothetical protein RJ639_035662 [Escallonia herrerae]|uniref:Uncharacterized protein n=1 Tax=Escallonia herrerae TaxID=1293975 RepID=A0AA88WRZ9_9ASTE|nr:hypothetical protein RJ639_035662 [Escallonia herrerae]